MRKLRLLVGRRHHHHLHLRWTVYILIILPLWITMGLAVRRSQQQISSSLIQDNSYPSPTAYQNQRIPVSPPLSLNLNRGRNALKDRLYYNPIPPPSSEHSPNSPPRRRAGGGRGSEQESTNFLLRPQNESPVGRLPISRGPSYPSPSSRRGTSTITSPTLISSSHLDNSLSNKLLEPEQQFPLVLPSSSRSGSDNRRYFNDNTNSGGGKSKKKSGKKSYPPRSASVNSILRLDPAQSIWDEAAAVCRTIPGLTREQMELCFKNPDATKVALQGLSLAADECAFQMSKNRWNCSSLQGRLNPHSTVLFKKGYKESAFGHAIASAGVAFSVSKACSQGNLLSCGCGFQYDDQVNFIPSKDADYTFDESNESSLKRWSSGGGRVQSQGSNSISSSWKWSGCSHNMDYGVKFAKLFLDSRERSSDLPSRINLHNNRVGRTAVSTNMEIRCKCHGLSGSCELRTCWRSVPEFRQVGSVLKNKFRRAVMIDQSELGNRPLNRIQRLKKQTRSRKRRDRTKRNSGAIDLWYYERSPTYCESNSDFSIPGTTGRVCNATQGGREMGSCSTLCCGRGYNTIRQVYTTRCQCQFIWCCEVTCKNCTVDEYITVCK